MKRKLVAPSAEYEIWNASHHDRECRILWNDRQSYAVVEVTSTLNLSYTENLHIKRHTTTDRFEIEGGRFSSLHQVWSHVTGEKVSLTVFQERIETAIKQIVEGG
jgi:hypothetical protein